MALLNFLFGKKNPLKQLEKMSPNDLEREQLRLEAQQDAIIGKVKTLEKRKDATLREGARKKSALERKAMAVRYRQIDSEAAGYVSQASLISKQIRVIGRMVQLKRRENLLKQEGLWSTIANIDAAELENFMIDMRTKSLQGDREASRLLEILEEPTETADEEDKDLQDVLAAMEAMGETEIDDAEIEEVKKKFLEKEDEEGATEA